MTVAGVLLGTAAYMSPEQAKGKPADKRSDLWAFGCVLYEMLAGVPAFPGDDVAEILAGVVKSEVDWARLPEAVPANVRILLRRCLRKDPRQRLGEAGAARLEIEETVQAPGDGRTSPPRMSRALAVALVLIAAAAAAGLTFMVAVHTREPIATPNQSPVAHLAITLPRGAELAEGASVAISPDGTAIAYIAERGNVPQIYVRSIGDVTPRAMAGTEQASGPFFSPDGQWLGFYAGGKLKKLSTSSGVVETLADARFLGNGGTWSPSGRLCF